jgi:hypothetical protein
VTLNQIAALAADQTFQNEVRAAALAEALSVMAEKSFPGAAENKRQALALATIADGYTALLPRFAWGIAATPGFSGVTDDTGDANDAAINSAIVSQWSNLAGVLPGDNRIASQVTQL